MSQPSRNDNYRCRGAISLGNNCGTCPHCREAAKAMHAGLWKIAARAENASPADIMAYVAEALGLKVAEVEAYVQERMT